MLRSTLPSSAPGLDILVELTARIRNIITIVSQVVVLMRIISVTNHPEAQILVFFGIAFLGVALFAPLNGVGGAGKTGEIFFASY